MLYTLQFPIFVNVAREALIGRYEYIPIRPYIQELKAARPSYKSTNSSIMVNFVYESDFVNQKEKKLEKYLKIIAYPEIPTYVGVNFKFLGAIEHAKRKPYYIYGKITTMKWLPQKWYP